MKGSDLAEFLIESKDSTQDYAFRAFASLKYQETQTKYNYKHCQVLKKIVFD